MEFLTIILQFCVQQNLDEAHSSPGLHAAAGPGLAEECATLVCSSMCHMFSRLFIS